MLISVPLSVPVGKKNFILNLNNFRGTHYHILNNAKRNYKPLVLSVLPRIKFTDPVEMIYTYYHGSKRKIDLSNACSIIDKFVCDVLVEKGVLTDDNTEHLRRVTYIWGGVDKKNPRCDIEIKNL